MEADYKEKGLNIKRVLRTLFPTKTYVKKRQGISIKIASIMQIGPRVVRITQKKIFQSIQNLR